MKISIQNSKLFLLLLFLFTIFFVGNITTHSGSSNTPGTPSNSNPPKDGENNKSPKTAPGGNREDDQKNGEDDEGDGGELDHFCSVVNPFTGAVIDLSALSTYQDDKSREATQANKDKRKKRWLVKGWDYDTNFTMSICSSSVVEELQDQLSNVTGGYYVDHGQNDKLVSIGDFSTKPRFNGKKLTMEYGNGDMCPNGYDRKSTLINFVCDREISKEAQFTFIGQLHNCSYFFEVRSIHACSIANVKNDLNVLGIFVSILIIFLLIEYTRRKVYQRLNNERSGQALHNSAPPRWITGRQDPWYKKVLKRFNWPQQNDRISLRTRASSSSLTFDMEQQNELLDSLDVEVNSSDL